MQLAGIPCSICSLSIKFETDATWCAACKTIFHRDCLSQGHNLCPTCKRVSDAPESHFVFSQFCPECMRPNHPPKFECSACRTRTRWDTRADYEQFVAQMKGVAHARMLRGIGELIGGVLCLLALIAIMAFSPFFYGVTFSTLGFILLTADGVVSLLKSRKFRQFK